MKKILMFVALCLTALVTLTNCQNKVDEPPVPSKYTLAELSSLKRGDFIQIGECQTIEACDGRLVMVERVQSGEDPSKLEDWGLSILEFRFSQPSPAMPLDFWIKDIKVITRYKDPDWPMMAHLFLTGTK